MKTSGQTKERGALTVSPNG